MPLCREKKMGHMQLHLSTLCFDANGQGEKSEYTYRGHYEERGNTCRLRWQREEGGSVTKTLLTFTKGKEQVVSLHQAGDSEAEMLFAVGEDQTGLYRVAGAGELPFSLVTERVENTLTPAGGRLHLSYVMHLGGVRQHIHLRLTATCHADGEEAAC